jgi:hypothetical protein
LTHSLVATASTELVATASTELVATASAELACAGRAFLGDPHKQRSASDRILHHHHTSAQEVMEFGIRLNEDPSRAQSSGGLVAEAAERCR